MPKDGLKAGYAYEFDGDGDWKSSPDDSWEVVMLSRGGGKRVGSRLVDGSRVIVFKRGKKYYAQTGAALGL